MALVENSYISLSFFLYFLSFIFEFHLRHSEDGADFHIFILSLSFSHYLLSLSYFINSNGKYYNTCDSKIMNLKSKIFLIKGKKEEIIVYIFLYMLHIYYYIIYFMYYIHKIYIHTYIYFCNFI